MEANQTNELSTGARKRKETKAALMCYPCFNLVNWSELFTVSSDPT